MTGESALTWMLRAAGATQIALGVAHVGFWRAFEWGAESARMSPLNARVFAAHAASVVFVLVAVGALSLARPDLLLAPGDLPLLLLLAIAALWLARLVAQPLVFDPFLLRGSRWRPWVRAFANVGLASYVAVYACAALWHFRELAR